MGLDYFLGVVQLIPSGLKPTSGSTGTSNSNMGTEAAAAVLASIYVYPAGKVPIV